MSAHAISANKNTVTKSEHAHKHGKITTEQIVKIIGSVASIMSVIMYVSYIPQIAANLAGNPGVFWQPLAALVNCIFWTAYGIGSKPKQWPIIIANVPGIFLAAITVVTCFVH